MQVKLKSGTFEGFRWNIGDSGICYCAYVEIPKGHPFYGKDNPHLICYGGVTYAKKGIETYGEDPDSWVLGWDYFHGWGEGYHVSIQQIEDDVRDVIRQVMRLSVLPGSD